MSTLPTAPQGWMLFIEVSQLGSMATRNSLVAADIPQLPASIINSGTFGTAFIADNAITNAKIASGVDAAKLTAGTLPIARIADGSVTNAKIASGFDAAKITTGTIPAARIPNNHLSIAQINTLQTSLNAKVNTSVTINGQPLSSNVNLTTQDVRVTTVTQLPTNAQPGTIVRMGNELYLKT